VRSDDDPQLTEAKMHAAGDSACALGGAMGGIVKERVLATS
jgi:hypothetical protein